MTHAPRGFLLIVAVRLVGTAVLRYPLPFIEDVADGLDVSITTLGFALAAGEVIGLGAPRLGRYLDSIDRRSGLRIGLVATVVASAMCALAPHVIVYGAGIAVLSAGRLTYDVSLTAWLGDTVVEARRGLMVGIAETAWSGSLFVGVPIAGLLNAAFGWQAPYLVLAVLMVLAIPLVAARIEADGGGIEHDVVAGHARVRAVHVTVFLLVLAGFVLIVVQGAWFERDLGLRTESIAAATVVLGAGELAGCVLSAALSDRLGAVRVVRIGLWILGPALAGVLLAGSSIAVAVATSVAIGLGLELALVSSFPVVLRVPANRRAGALGLVVLAVTGARFVATLGAPATFERFGVAGPALVGIALTVAALVAAGRIDPNPADDVDTSVDVDV